MSDLMHMVLICKGIMILMACQLTGGMCQFIVMVREGLNTIKLTITPQWNMALLLFIIVSRRLG